LKIEHKIIPKIWT